MEDRRTRGASDRGAPTRADGDRPSTEREVVRRGECGREIEWRPESAGNCDFEWGGVAADEECAAAFGCADGRARSGRCVFAFR